jgi:hypothetical protein
VNRTRLRQVRLWRDIATVLTLIGGAFVVWRCRIEAPGPLTLGTSDLLSYFWPAFTYMAERLRAGELPLWNPWQGLGRPFLATMQPAVLYPARLLLLVLDVPSAMRVSALAHVLLILVATYVLLRALATSRMSAAAGAVTASAILGAGNLGWTSYLEPAAWFAVAALAVVRIAAGGSSVWVLVLGAAAGLPVLAGGYQVAVYVAYALGVLGLALLADGTRRCVSAPRFLLLLGIAAGLAVATAAPQFAATVAWAEQTVRGARPLTAAQIDPIPGLLPPLQFFRLLVTSAGAPSWLHFSWPVLVLAVIGACSAGRFGALLGGGVLVSMLLALGRTTTCFPVYQYLPGIRMLRFPMRLTILAGFLITPLVALGLDTLRRRAGRGSHVVALAGLGSVVAALVLPLDDRPGRAG